MRGTSASEHPRSVDPVNGEIPGALSDLAQHARVLTQWMVQFHDRATDKGYVLVLCKICVVLLSGVIRGVSGQAPKDAKFLTDLIRRYCVEGISANEHLRG